MSENLYFRRQALQSLLGGVSVLDAPKLSVRDHKEAQDFISSYGFSWDEEKDRQEIYSFFIQALAFLQDHFAQEESRALSDLFEDHGIKDVRDVLVSASTRRPGSEKIQKWSCALLKVMHTMAHLEKDPYSTFYQEIRSQILTPIEGHVAQDPVGGGTYFQIGERKIRLYKFHVKPGKDTSSAVIKLLAKKRLTALNILDRVGVRFVTRNTFDIFQVIRILEEGALVSYPHCIVNESANRVYPTDLFLGVMDGLRSKNPMASEKEIEEILSKKIIDRPMLDRDKDSGFKIKENAFTDPGYKFVKFISRKLIRVPLEYGESKKGVEFFYPFEVQIMDYSAYTQNMRGALNHQEYKKRQKKAAHQRLFGLN